MASVNNVIVGGTLGRDPEARYKPGGEAASKRQISHAEFAKRVSSVGASRHGSDSIGKEREERG